MANKKAKPAHSWFKSMGWRALPFQEKAWDEIIQGRHGLVNAPTGSGKTYSVMLGAMCQFIDRKEDYTNAFNQGIQVIWITPIRALAKEIELAAQRAVKGLDMPWEIAKRTGDTSTAQRAKIKRKPPELLITTPESLHLMLASKKYDKLFKSLHFVVCDEWHELVGSKRGVLMELALSRLKTVSPKMQIWGISATIGNMQQAAKMLLGKEYDQPWSFVKADIKKQIEVKSIFPDSVETLPWAGHLGAKLLDKVLPIVEQSRSTLLFTNTRSQTEIWYQKILQAAPELAGTIAMHHGSMSRELRDWVESALHDGLLKLVVCTSSLDLGVDFRPVETIIQVGSPKGVSRFLQRAGRSGHQPGSKSAIYFLPTHSLELVEAAALRLAIQQNYVEDRIPHIRSFDVLIQYLVTLAVSDGFKPTEIFEEVRGTFSYESINADEWNWVLDFITQGGVSLHAYEDFHKVLVEDGIYKVKSRRIAQRHRLSIGTIVSDASLAVKYQNGKQIGTIEEWFISRLKAGDVFIMGGKTLEFIRIKEMTAQVRPSKAKKGIVPSWGGGRMPLSAQMAVVLRNQLMNYNSPERQEELSFLQSLFDRQNKESAVPSEEECLVEYFTTREGYHLMVYPFEGRFVHEGLGALLAYRISLLQPISFSIAMNDYGFELLSDEPIPLQAILDNNLFSTEYLQEDILASINAAEMARRKFRDIASISGLIFKGYPGKQQKEKHVQSSSQLFFDVFRDYEPDNLLLIQAQEEVLTFQLEEQRLRKALERMQGQKIVLKKPNKPTPFAFPIMVDRLREKLSSEKLEDRIAKMTVQFE